MTDINKEKDIVELSAEALEEAAGGAYKKDRYLRVTKDCNVRVGPGKDYMVLHAVRKGDMIKGVAGEVMDERGVKWFIVLSGRGVMGYISSKCAELI